ncbi:AAA-like domain-containing protein [Nostoc sp. UHCC 0702]|nr:AAA-like domain-containing protein [Nostoc sp. UHCC 0702]
MKQAKTTRKRGVLLTSVGLKRLQRAIRAVEIKQNKGHRFSLDELSDRMNISTKTLNRLWYSSVSVDRRTLKLCFNAFGLELSEEDYSIETVEDNQTAQALYSSLDSHDKPIYPLTSIVKSSLSRQQPRNLEFYCSYPDGPVPLDSPLYIKRPPIEELVYQEITQPGSVIRIHAPREMGKSSLVLRLLAFAHQQEYYTIKLDCHQIDAFCLSNLDQFFRSFCWRLATELGIDPQLDAYWDEEIGSKFSCSFYLKNYLLKQIQRPIVVVLERVDRFFEYPQIAQEFFPLLRSWHEEGHQDSNWQKLRLVIVYSTEVHLTFDINRSPFNIGLPLRLSDFTLQQVEELARQHELKWKSRKEASKLMSLVGGHPALIRIALYYLTCQGMTLEELLQEASANGGIYRQHLWRYWTQLQENPSLLEAYTQVVTTKQSIYLDPIQVYQLDSLGLIAYEGDRIKPRCQLYRVYFAKQLSMDSH